MSRETYTIDGINFSATSYNQAVIAYKKSKPELSDSIHAYTSAFFDPSVKWIDIIGETHLMKDLFLERIDQHGGIQSVSQLTVGQFRLVYNDGKSDQIYIGR